MASEKIVKAFEAILEQLPECKCRAERLALAADYFELSAKDMLRAVVELRSIHQLEYEGVRRLLSLCLEEFEEQVLKREKRLCNVSVPSPPAAMYAIQRAKPEISFCSAAFFAQIVLRGIIQCRRPLDIVSCSKRRCGLNKMAERLMTQAPVREPEYQLMFGVLCDECVKTGEELGKGQRFTLSVPGGQAGCKEIAEAFFQRLCRELEIKVKPEDMKWGYGLYGRLMKAEREILALCARRDREPLWGNSLALAQSVQLMCSERMEEFVQAVELLAEELQDAREMEMKKRVYCYYIPFLQPGIDKRFRENGVALLGGAAFLERGKSLGLGLGGSMEAWLKSMGLRAGEKEQCALIAQAMRELDCSLYLTGSFKFDRYLGALMPIQRRILREEHGIDCQVLDADFWCENTMFGNLNERIDHICEWEELL